MKRKIIIFIWCLLFALVLAAAVCAVVLPDQPNWKLFSKGIITLAALFSAAFLKRRRPADNFKVLQSYRQNFSEFLGRDCPKNLRFRKALEHAVLDMHYGRYDKAIQRLDKLVQQADEDTQTLVSALYFRGFCQQLSGNRVACAADWEELLQYRADSSTVWDALGTTYFRLDRVDDAIRCYDTALLYDSKNASSYGNLATMYYLKKGDSQKAAAYAEKALQLKPDLYGVCSTLAMIYRSLGDSEKSSYYRNQYAAHMPEEDAAGLDEMLAEIPLTENM